MAQLDALERAVRMGGTVRKQDPATSASSLRELIAEIRPRGGRRWRAQLRRAQRLSDRLSQRAGRHGKPAVDPSTVVQLVATGPDQLPYERVDPGKQLSDRDRRPRTSTADVHAPRIIKADRSGTCAACSRHYRPGTRITQDERGWVHALCRPQSPRPALPSYPDACKSKILNGETFRGWGTNTWRRGKGPGSY
ncbi:hypothetical protein [Saccharomonospora iraqiensis]|uniref:hypothetical protein n=1 Tax=Saccharomonospora iraqiensis TaxID=52698 RepID=UPI0012B66703|nr:hypothetical protein [Saccharomonospora iraqiensis]